MKAMFACSAALPHRGRPQTTIQHLSISLLEKGASVFMMVLKITPSGFLNPPVYWNTYIPPKPSMYHLQDNEMHLENEEEVPD